MKQNDLEQLKSFPNRQCQNCDFVYDGYFCPSCGQRFMEGRYKFKESTQWVMGQVLNLDKGFFYTIWKLLIHPGEVLNNYLQKATVRYMHPFRFVFIVATLTALITLLSGTFESDMSAYMGEQNSEDIARVGRIIDFIKKYLSLIMLLSIPFYALGSYLVYKNKKNNYTEHLIINSFTYGLSLIISWPLDALLFLPDGLMWNGALSATTSFISFAWVYSSFFKENYLLSLVKAIGVSIIAIITGSIIMVAIGLGSIIVYKGILK